MGSQSVCGAWCVVVVGIAVGVEACASEGRQVVSFDDQHKRDRVRGGRAKAYRVVLVEWENGWMCSKANGVWVDGVSVTGVDRLGDCLNGR